jgi:hypothetical protein
MVKAEALQSNPQTDRTNALSAELSALSRMQYEALLTSPYTKMSSQESAEYNSRRVSIGKIRDLLAKYRAWARPLVTVHRRRCATAAKGSSSHHSVSHISTQPVGLIAQRAFFWAGEQHGAASHSDCREVNHMSQHEHERKILDDLLSRTIKAVHLELLIGYIWHSAYMEKKRLDRQSQTEAQSQGRLLYRASIVFASDDAASLKRALPDGPSLQAGCVKSARQSKMPSGPFKTWNLHTGDRMQ